MKTAFLTLLLLLTGCPGATRDEVPAPAQPPPAERCTACHPQRPADAHAALPCSSCHGGDPRALGKEAAHVGLEAEPGALDSVFSTCGQAGCHPVEAARVLTSPMTVGAGIITATRKAFGEAASAASLATVLQSPTPSPADDYARRLCAGCHLGTRRLNRDDGIATRGSGCSACHLREAAGHPSSTTFPADDRCAGCHSRSGRIALSYAGRVEQGDFPCPDPHPLPDGRTTCAAPADVHHAAGLSCVDCHLHTELMGSGQVVASERDAVQLRCADCHTPSAGVAVGEITDTFTQRLLKRHAPGFDGRVGASARGTPIWNLHATASGPWTLVGKADGRPHAVPLTPRDAAHAQPGHERLACASCHAAWTPTCLNCHVDFLPDGEQWDFGTASVARGRWRERGSGAPPTVPVLAVGADDRIVPATPGMILSVDATAAGGAEHTRRWFAPLDPHTTSREGRSCSSCHRSPQALGLGSGELRVERGRWCFEPYHPDPAAPGRARDGWIRQGQATPGESADGRIRSLSTAELRRVLRVGWCLSCHTGAEPWWAEPAAAFQRARLAPMRCTPPPQQ